MPAPPLLRPGGGDPLALVQLAVDKRKQREKKGDDYAAASVLVLLDESRQNAHLLADDAEQVCKFWVPVQVISH